MIDQRNDVCYVSPITVPIGKRDVRFGFYFPDTAPRSGCSPRARLIFSFFDNQPQSSAQSRPSCFACPQPPKIFGNLGLGLM